MNFNKFLKRTVVVLSIPLFIFSVYRVYEYHKIITNEQTYQQAIDDLAPTVNDSRDKNPVKPTPQGNTEDTDNESDKEKVSEGGGYGYRSTAGWAYDLVERNSEAVGWIRIPGFTDWYGNEYINYPVLQHSDNVYYLTHNLDHQYYYSGSIYVDYEDPITASSQPDNIVMYGHHMRNLGTAFTHLAEYKSGAWFLKKYPIVEFNTIYDPGPYEYVIFSCYVAAENETQDEDMFDYWHYHNFTNDAVFDYWLKRTRDSSWYTCDIKCDKDDDYITLSTCSNEVLHMRWVMTAKRLDGDDDKDKIIDSIKAKDDEDIYFPDVWKKVWGNHPKYLGWNY